jgi:hypothetical protein
LLKPCESLDLFMALTYGFKAQLRSGAKKQKRTDSVKTVSP